MASKVDHKTILLKLLKCGIESTSYSWFTSYLTNGEQFCYCDGANSSKSILKNGIPQGSSLGPLLFLLYINDFENCLEIDDPLKNEMENISNWMRTNKLSLNARKSEFIVVGHRRMLNRVGNELPNVVLNNEVIKRFEKLKCLGINIDQSLNWEEQYKTVKNKLKRGISSFRKLKDNTPQRQREQVCKALFESHLRYGDIV